MNFLFRTGKYDLPGLTQQLSRALEKRTELESRAKMPRMWRTIDNLNDKKEPDEVLEKRRRRNRIYGVVLLILGVFLLVPGLMDPEKMTLQLFAGCVGIVAGVLCLRPRSMRSSNLQRRFERAANELLKALREAPATDVRFTDEGMQLGESDTVPYADFTCCVEAQDLYLFVWNGKVTALLKRDFAAGDAEEFGAMLRSKLAVSELDDAR